MQKLLHELDVVSLTSHLKCKGPLFTWTGETCNSYVNRYMINHILISNSMLDLVSHCQVHDSHPLNTSDHRPVQASFFVKPLVVNTDLFVRKKYNWEKYSRLEIECSYITLCNLKNYFLILTYPI